MITIEKIKESLIEEGISEEMAEKYSSDVSEKLKKYEYDEFYYRILFNNRIYFFVRKKIDENSTSIHALNKEGYPIL